MIYYSGIEDTSCWCISLNKVLKRFCHKNPDMSVSVYTTLVMRPCHCQFLNLGTMGIWEQAAFCSGWLSCTVG